MVSGRCCHLLRHDQFLSPTELLALDLKSRGFLAFRDYLSHYISSPRFERRYLSETRKLKTALADIEYCIVVRGSSLTVRKYEGETDYSADVEETFAKFKQGAVNDYKVKFPANLDMNHIEAKIVEFVAKLHPELFVALRNFCTANQAFMDRTIAAFDREVQFYVAYLEYCTPLKRVRLPFCYPLVSNKSKEVYDRDSFDIALAHKLIGQSSAVVCNDFYLKGRERILVVSGPNQGGKTTFARAFGQLHYLANIGCPVPGGRRSFSFSISFSLTSKSRRRWKIYAASWKTTWCGFTESLAKRRRDRSLS